MSVVRQQLDTIESVPRWCSINIKLGQLMVVLNEHDCFEAEVYIDQLVTDQICDFPEDQRGTFQPTLINIESANPY